MSPVAREQTPQLLSSKQGSKTVSGSKKRAEKPSWNRCNDAGWKNVTYNLPVTFELSASLSHSFESSPYSKKVACRMIKWPKSVTLGTYKENSNHSLGVPHEMKVCLITQVSIINTIERQFSFLQDNHRKWRTKSDLAPKQHRSVVVHSFSEHSLKNKARERYMKHFHEVFSFCQSVKPGKYKENTKSEEMEIQHTEWHTWIQAGLVSQSQIERQVLNHPTNTPSLNQRPGYRRSWWSIMEP